MMIRLLMLSGLIFITGCSSLAPSPESPVEQDINEAKQPVLQSSRVTGAVSPPGQHAETTLLPPTKQGEPSVTSTSAPTVPELAETPIGQKPDLEQCTDLLTTYDNPSDRYQVLDGSDKGTQALSNRLDRLTRETKQRSIAVFLDGTHNTKESRTNIWRLYSRSVAAACNGAQVVPRYFRGVGTDKLNRARGGITGNGLDILIRDSYQHIAEVYQPGDRIFLFGFSRGAYAARSLNGFIKFVGLLDGSDPRYKPRMVKDLFKRYNVNNDGSRLFELQHLAEMATSRVDHPIHHSTNGSNEVHVEAIGVFDTVAALGLARDDFPDNHRTDLYAEWGFHAIAIDEQRNDFRELRFDDRIDDSQHLEEVWFVGGHGNVGGGYEGGLEMVSLDWMLTRLKDTRLFADFQESIGCGDLDCALAPMNDEFLDSSMFGKMGLHWRRPQPGEVIHGSVVCRMDEKKLTHAREDREPGGRYQPGNLYPIDRYAIEEYKGATCDIPGTTPDCSHFACKQTSD